VYSLEKRRKQHGREAPGGHQATRTERRQNVNQDERGVGDGEPPRRRPDRRESEHHAHSVQEADDVLDITLQVAAGILTGAKVSSLERFPIVRSTAIMVLLRRGGLHGAVLDGFADAGVGGL
ncbi:MAG: hypothetical protein ACREBE_19285, partial [bacterium]